MTFVRDRVVTPDQDFIDLDFPQFPDISFRESAPLVVLLHGLEGSARRGYACEAYRQLATRGIRSVGMNFRSCSGEMNLTAKFYHAGATEDVALILNYLEEKFPNVVKGIIGVSLGGNMLLKLLGEGRFNIPDTYRSAVAISPPFDMILSSKKLIKFPGTIYGRRFLGFLKEKVKAKKELLTGLVDVDRVLASQTLVEFDEFGTGPLNGFANADDYYSRCSCGQFLKEIQRPTMVLRAADDPLMDPRDIPYDVFQHNPNLTGVFTEKGGHVGFMSKNGHAAGRYWGEIHAAAYLESHLMETNNHRKVAR